MPASRESPAGGLVEQVDAGGQRVELPQRRVPLLCPRPGSRRSGGVKNVTTVTDAGRSSIRNCDASGACSASATTTLIGVTWLATTTVLPARASRRRSSAAEHALLDHHQRLAAARPLVDRAEPLLQARVARWRPPPRRSARPRCRTPSRRSRGPPRACAPSRSARISPDSRARRTGEATTASTRSASGASQSAVARIWSRPSSLRPGLALASPPENRFSVVCAVTPCRTRISVVWT